MSPFLSRRGGRVIVKPLILKKVLPEKTFFYLVFKVLVRGEYEAGVDLRLLRVAQLHEGPRLQGAQYLRLDGYAHVAHLIDEKSAVMGYLQESELICLGARKRASLVAEKLAFEDALLEGARIDRYEGVPTRPERSCMDLATTSLPTPVSPRISTGVPEAATMDISFRTFMICLLRHESVMGRSCGGLRNDDLFFYGLVLGLAMTFSISAIFPA